VSHNILNRWKNYFAQLFNVHNTNVVKQTEIHAAVSLLAGPSPLNIEIAIAKLGKYTSLGSEHHLAELIQAGGEIFLSVAHKYINSI
jgi:hypothetical protein